MVEKGHYFYVLYCRDQTLYAGYTNNLSHRLQTHNAGKGAKYTRPQSRRPLSLIYAEAWSTQRQAMQQEYRFKKLNRRQKETYLIQGRERSLAEKDFVLKDFREVKIDADSTEL